jgi:SET domain-containing protein
MYRPLPDYLQILQSPIEGYGLFTTKDLASGLEVGIMRVEDDRFADDYIRTPLGGFVNHADDPNCEAYTDGDLVRLRTIKQISSGSEMTVHYWIKSYTIETFTKI